MRELKHHRRERNQVRSIVALAPFLAADHSAELIRLAEALPEDADRVDPLVAVARYAPELERDAILATALAAEGSGAGLWPSRAPIKVAKCLPEPRRLKVFQDALGRITSMDEGEARAKEIAALAPHLPTKLLGEAADIVGMTRVPKARADARRALAEAANPADPENWRFWRSALADAVAVGRSTVLSIAVNACLAAGGDVPRVKPSRRQPISPRPFLPRCAGGRAAPSPVGQGRKLWRSRWCPPSIPSRSTTRTRKHGCPTDHSGSTRELRRNLD